MATSGNIDKELNSWLKMRIRWVANSQNIANNTTNMSVSVQLICGNGHINSSAPKDIALTINGTKYTSTCTVGISSNTTRTLFTKTVDVPHNADGSKTVAISCLLTFDVTISGTWWGDRSLSGNATLNTIPRKSTLTASNGTLGTAQTLTIDRKSSSFTHTIKYECGSASGTIATKTTGTSVSFTPPLSLASQNTTGTTVSVKFTITTYSGSTSLGSNTKTITCSIPSSVKPSCSISVSDAAGYSVYVKGYSKFKITVTPTTSYGSAIASYSVSANGATYTTASVTTSVLSSSGTLTITATVKDKRGRTGTATKTVTVYDKSTFAARGTLLGSAQKIVISSEHSDFKHTLKYTCGSASGTIATKVSEGLVSFVPDISLASQNTTGLTIPLKLTLTTYCDDKSIGSNSQTITCTIPDDVTPSIAIGVTDTTGAAEIYGAMVKGLSNLKVDLSATKAYGSDITTYNSTALGRKYTATSFEIGVIPSASDLKITSSVTDKRGRTGTTTETISGILDYSPPEISRLVVGRCDEDGAANEKGEFVKVTYSATVTSLNELNSAKYVLQYKKTTESSYTTGETVNSVYSITDRVFIFPADTGSSYDVLITATDSHNETTKTTVASTGFVVLHFGADGKSMGIGKIAELSGVLDIGFETMFSGGIKGFVLEENTDLNDVLLPNIYIGDNISSKNYLNCPFANGTFVLRVDASGPAGQVRQEIIMCSKTESVKYERYYYQESWGEWICTSDFKGRVLWSGVSKMIDTDRIELSEPISRQRTGIRLVFSRYNPSTQNAANDNFVHHFVDKQFVGMHPGTSSTFALFRHLFANVGIKVLYIKDTEITGHADNFVETENGAISSATSSGITYHQNMWVLRYVIGV